MDIMPTVPDDMFDNPVAALAFDSIFDSPSEAASSPDHQDEQHCEVLDGIIEEVIFGFCLEVHRMCRLGTFQLDDTDPESSKEFEIVDMPGRDIFGQVPMKKSLECVCPNCERNMAASRFAPHLEKCMGMGRCSSRVASRRIANNISKQEGSDNDSMQGDGDNDNEWSAYASATADKKSKRVKKERNTNSPKPRIKSAGKQRSADGAGELSCQTVLDNMTPDERRTLLQNICGAVSDQPTRKLCTRSVRCTQHSDEQRQTSRNYLLLDIRRGIAAEDDVVDIDTFDDVDSQSLRDSLWEKELTPSASPADSTSTVNSSGSRKRGRKKKRK